MRRLYSKRCRDRPGVSIPALAVPRDGSSPPEPVLIYFGIIDFLQVSQHHRVFDLDPMPPTTPNPLLLLCT